MKKFVQFCVVALVALAMVFGAALPGSAADHLDAPAVKNDGRIDINDIYVFHPGDPGAQDLSRTVLAMTVNPAAGVISGTSFRPGALYEFAIDINGDAREDKVVRAQFGAVRGKLGKQKVAISLCSPKNRRAGLVGRKAEKTVCRQLVKGPIESVLRGRANGVTAYAGLRDDPFFFDLASFNDGATFCQAGDVDFFLGLNTSAIVVELPTDWLGDSIGVWGRTVVPKMGQLDRMGRPAINTVFIPANPFEPAEPSQEDAFNFTRPTDDQAMWRAEVVDSLTVLFSLNDSAGDDPSDDAATIQALADILLPDILTVDLTKETGFLNGRNLADDVIDAELGIITEGLITTDCIANDSTFLAAFPYLGAPNP